MEKRNILEKSLVISERSPDILHLNKGILSNFNQPNGSIGIASHTIEDKHFLNVTMQKIILLWSTLMLDKFDQGAIGQFKFWDIVFLCLT